jgi:hypothetical protein
VSCRVVLFLLSHSFIFLIHDRAKRAMEGLGDPKDSLGIDQGDLCCEAGRQPGCIRGARGGVHGQGRGASDSARLGWKSDQGDRTGRNLRCGTRRDRRGPESIEDRLNGPPWPAVIDHHGMGSGAELVVLALATGFRSAPAGVDEPIGLQSVEDRVKHAIGPLDLPAGEFPYLLDDGVAVAFASLKDAQDLGAG